MLIWGFYQNGALMNRAPMISSCDRLVNRCMCVSRAYPWKLLEILSNIKEVVLPSSTHPQCRRVPALPHLCYRSLAITCLFHFTVF